MNGQAVTLSAETPVSMNIWGFTADVFDHLESGLRRFFAADGPAAGAEFYLPDQVEASVSGRDIRVRAYQCKDRVQGLTYREDLERM